MLPVKYREPTMNRLLERSKGIVQRARFNVLRARATAIRASQVIQTAKAVLYENRLIRRKP